MGSWVPVVGILIAQCGMLSDDKRGVYAYLVCISGPSSACTPALCGYTTMSRPATPPTRGAVAASPLSLYTKHPWLQQGCTTHTTHTGTVCMRFASVTCTCVGYGLWSSGSYSGRDTLQLAHLVVFTRYSIVLALYVQWHKLDDDTYVWAWC